MRYIIFKRKYIEYEISGIKKNKVAREKFHEMIFRESGAISVTSSELEKLIIFGDLFKNFINEERLYDCSPFFYDLPRTENDRPEGARVRSFLTLSIREAEKLTGKIKQLGYEMIEEIEGFNQKLNEKFKTNEELDIENEQAQEEYEKYFMEHEYEHFSDEPSGFDP